MAFRRGRLSDPFGRLTHAAHRPVNPEDPTHSTGESRAYWTRANVSEACPGVLTPLTWALWSQTSDHAEFGMFGALGVEPNRYRAPVSLDDQGMAIFFGRLYMNFDVMRQTMDRFGSAGADYERHHFGAARDLPARSKPYARYPVMAVKAPWTLMTIGGRVTTELATRERDWRRALKALETADLAHAVEELTNGFMAYDQAMRVQTLTTAIATTILGQLFQSIAKIDPELAAPATSGAGGTRETEMLRQLWEVARGKRTTAAFLDAYGYCSPRDGELSATPWRESLSPLEPALRAYRESGDDGDPSRLGRETDRARERARATILERSAPRDRFVLKRMFAYSDKMTRLREEGKAAYLIGIDHARAAAARIGALMVHADILDDVNDIYFLLPEDIERLPWSGARRLIVQRRARLAEFEKVDAPHIAMGAPQATPKKEGAGRSNTVTGIGVSPGQVHGFARVMETAADVDRFAPGDILIAASTDPSWAPLMTVAGGIVTDLGGFLSHGAVIARELGIPAVVGAIGATDEIADGAPIFVDGAAGKVAPSTSETVEAALKLAPRLRARDAAPTKAPPKIAQEPPRLEALGSGLQQISFGGKAAALDVAIAAGLPAPPGLALNPSAAAKIAEQGNLHLVTCAAFLAEVGRVAVRSSAIGEDGGTASFAGLHETVLGVTTRDALVDAIARVGASASRSETYGSIVGVEAGGVGVVIQKQLRPDCAGVLFSHDPVTGAPQRIVEVVHGLGEALVSGAVTPRRYRFAAGAREVGEDPGRQTFRLDFKPSGGLERSELTGDLMEGPALTAAQLRELDALVQRCLNVFGGPQDLEWAFEEGVLYLLQSRPITTLARLEEH